MCLALRASPEHLAFPTCLAFRAPHRFRCERLCPFAEERAPARSGVPDPIVAIEVQRASDAAIVRIAKQNNATEATIRSSTIKNDAKVQKISYNKVKEL